jgi:hypothetical protein
VFYQQCLTRPKATFLKTQEEQILSAALGRMLILLGSGSVVAIVLGAAASRLLSAVAGPVRRVLHADSATCSANNNFQARFGPPI